METDVWNVYKYCPRCGSPLTLTSSDDGPSLQCSADGFVFYQNPHSAVSVVISDGQGKYLFVRRDKDPNKGDWDLPGGFVNWGESPETAIVREIREELGVELTISKILCAEHDWYPFAGLNSSVNSVVYLGTISGPIAPNEEIRSLHWLTKEELPTNHLSFQNVSKAIQLLRP